VPLAPFFVPGLVAGAIRVKLWQFLLGTFFGMLPGTLATTIFTEQLQIAFAEGGQINYGIVAGVVLTYAAVTLLVRRWFKGLYGGDKLNSNPSSQRHGDTEKTQGTKWGKPARMPSNVFPAHSE
jgi:hypothetical protein